MNTRGLYQIPPKTATNLVQLDSLSSSPLWKEYLLFSRIYYKNRNQHGRSKHFKHFCQAKRLLVRLKSFDIDNVVFIGHTCSKNEDLVHTAQALQQQQILLIGLAKLIDACCMALRMAYSSHHQVANQTFFLPYCVAAMACFARLHYFLQDIKQSANSLYSKIYIARKQHTDGMPITIDSVDSSHWFTCTPEDLFPIGRASCPVIVDSNEFQERVIAPITNTLSDKYFDKKLHQSPKRPAKIPGKPALAKKAKHLPQKIHDADEIDDIFGNI
jgi:hypothetical protein